MEETKLNYNLSQLELQTGNLNLEKPHILIKGQLFVENFDSTEICFVKLPKKVTAKEAKGNELVIALEGTIGKQKLSSEKFIHPSFETGNVVDFEIEGFVDPKSYKNGLPPGSYTYKEDLNLIVEFHE